MQDLAQLLTSMKKSYLPEWKLAQFNGDPLQWHESFGQFKSAIDSSSLTDDVKYIYLKTLVFGKAQTAIAEFAYCATFYKEAPKTLERKFRSLNYIQKLAAVQMLQVVQKLPPSLIRRVVNAYSEARLEPTDSDRLQRLAGRQS